MLQQESQADPEQWTRIVTIEEFVARFADRRLSGEDATFVIHSNGQISGEIGEQILSGEWYWQDGLFWRRASLDSEDLGWDSEVIEHSGRRMKYIKDGGRGPTTVVTA